MSLSLFHQINSKYYIKKDTRKLRKIIKFSGLGLLISGLLFGSYFFFPLISWKLYLEPVFASQDVIAPIPRTTVITKDYIQSLWLNTARSVQGLYDTNAQNWIPSVPAADHSLAIKEVQVATQLSYYFISIPKIRISNAIVSTVDTDLSQHLVNFPDTSIPPSLGNAVVFGHSTLPQLFDPKNYKTIFAYAHTLEVGDIISVFANDKTYTYKIYNISIVDPEDKSYFTQENDDSYFTIVTCTPPGTTWKRLIIRARLEKI